MFSTSWFKGLTRVIAGVALIAGGIGIIEIAPALYGCGVFIIMAEIGNMMVGE
jgi:hypothetical protein